MEKIREKIDAGLSGMLIGGAFGLFIMGVIDHSVLYSVGAVVMGMIGLVKYYEDNSTTPKS